MKLVVVDDSKPFQRSLTRLLSTVDGITIVGYAEDLETARRVIDESNPEIVVLDAELRGGDRGIDVLRLVAREHPSIQVVALSNLDWQASRRSYLDAGAAAYFDKSMEFEQARDWIAARARSAAERGDGDQDGVGPGRV